MSGSERVTTVDDTGRDRADWDRIEQVLLQQPAAVTPSDATTVPREGARSAAPSGGADEAAAIQPAPAPEPARAPEPTRPPEPAAEPAATPRPATIAEPHRASEPAAAARSAVAAEPRPTEDDASSTALFAGGQADQLRSRWNGIQAGFVDDPRESVHEADALVAEVMKQLASTFAAERSGLESQWSRGDDVSTEDLRQALRRYRSFFDRLLSF
jgi:hypothetical protein